MNGAAPYLFYVTDVNIKALRGHHQQHQQQQFEAVGKSCCKNTFFWGFLLPLDEDNNVKPT